MDRGLGGTRQGYRWTTCNATGGRQSVLQLDNALGYMRTKRGLTDLPVSSGEFRFDSVRLEQTLKACVARQQHGTTSPPAAWDRVRHAEGEDHPSLRAGRPGRTRRTLPPRAIDLPLSRPGRRSRDTGGGLGRGHEPTLPKMCADQHLIWRRTIATQIASPGSLSNPDFAVK